MEIEIIDVPPQRYACLRTKAPLAEMSTRIGQIFQQVLERSSARGLTMAGPPYARYHSHDPAALDFEAGMPIHEEATSDDELCICTIGGPAATAVHAGPYDSLGETYAEMIAWLAGQGRTPAGPMWEVYLTEPEQVPDPADYQTRVYIPVAAESSTQAP